MVWTGAQCMDDGAQRQLGDNPEQVQVTNPVAATGQGTAGPDTHNPAMNASGDKMDDKTHQGICQETRCNWPRLVCTKPQKHSSRGINQGMIPN